MLPCWPTVRNHCVSGSGLERPVVEGENPVHENAMTVVMETQVAPAREIWCESVGTTR